MSKCYRPRCKREAEFTVVQMSWLSESCERHLGELIANRTRGETRTATVARLGAVEDGE